MAINPSEYKNLTNELVVGASGGGVPAQNIAVAKMPVDGAVALKLKNMGAEAVTWQLFARGRLTVVAAENIDALRVGATDQYQGLLGNTWITPGSVVITDAGILSVSDDGSGNLVDTATGLITVGTINYETGAIDFTFYAAVTPAVTVAYTHTGWIAFTAPITGTLAAGGGERFVDLMNHTTSDNYADGVKGQTFLGIGAYSANLGSTLGIVAIHEGDSTTFRLQLNDQFRPLNVPAPGQNT